jgi:hypothetical protein
VLGQRIEPLASITLLPKHGILVNLEECRGAYSGDVNDVFQRGVNGRSGDVNKVGAQRRWDCKHVAFGGK